MSPSSITTGVKPPPSPPRLRFMLLVACTALQVGCVQLAEVDSTHSPIYRGMLGREFELKEEFVVRGVKLPPKFNEVDHILIMPPPGIYSTYRILDFGHMPAGRRFRIVGVVTHSFKLVPFTQYVISFVDHRISQAEGRQVRIQDAAAWQLYVKPASPDEAPQLSERYFRPVDAPR